MKIFVTLTTILVAWMSITVSTPGHASPANKVLVAQGRHALEQRDIKKALKLFRQAVEKSPDDTEANYFLAYVLLQTGQVKQGFAALEKSIRLSPNNVGLRMTAGDMYAIHRRFPQAIEQFRMVLRLAEPDSKQAEQASKKISIAMVNRHTDNGDIESATFLLNSLLEQYPGDQFLYLTQAKLMAQASRYKEAESAYAKLLKLNPNNLQARIELALVYQKQSKNKEAEKQLYEVVKRDPKGKAGKQAALSIAIQRNNALVAEGRLQDAIANYQEMLRFDPDNSVALVNVAELAFRLNQLDLSRQAYERVAKINPNDASVHFRLGRIYYQIKQFDRAIAELQTVVRLSGDSDLGAQAQANLEKMQQQRSQAVARQGGLEQQLKSVGEVIKSNPGDIQARMKKAALHIRGNELEQARRELEQVTNLDPDNLLALLQLGQVYENIGLTAEADIAYAKVASKDKQGDVGRKAALRVISLGAKRLLNEGKQEEAKREFLNIIERDNNDANAHYFLALIYQRDKQLEQTAKSYKEVIRIRPNNLYARYNLANIYEQLNLEDDAMREYRGIIQRGRNSKMAVLAKRRLGKVESRLSGLTFGLDYGISYDNNTNFGKAGEEINIRRITNTCGADDTSPQCFVLASIEPIADYKTDFQLRFAYRNKLTDLLRWGVSSDASYTVFHDSAFDFIKLSVSPSLSVGRYRHVLTMSLQTEKANGLLNPNAESNGLSGRFELLQRFRMRPWTSIFWGDKEHVSTSHRIISAYRTFDSSQDAFDSKNLFFGYVLNQSPSPGLNSSVSYTLVDNENLDKDGSDFASVSHSLNVSMQKLLFFGIMAGVDFTLSGKFFKHDDIGTFQATGDRVKRLVLNNNMSLRLNYRYHENLSFTLGYTNILNSSNLKLRTTQFDENLLEAPLQNDQVVVEQFQTPSLGTYNKSVVFFSVNMNIQ